MLMVKTWKHYPNPSVRHIETEASNPCLQKKHDRHGKLRSFATAPAAQPLMQINPKFWKLRPRGAAHTVEAARRAGG